MRKRVSESLLDWNRSSENEGKEEECSTIDIVLHRIYIRTIDTQIIIQRNRKGDHRRQEKADRRIGFHIQVTQRNGD